MEVLEVLNENLLMSLLLRVVYWSELVLVSSMRFGLANVSVVTVETVLLQDCF